MTFLFLCEIPLEVIWSGFSFSDTCIEMIYVPDSAEMASKANSLDSGIPCEAAVGEGIDDDYDHIVAKSDHHSHRVSADHEPAYEELQVAGETGQSESDKLAGSYDRPNCRGAVDVDHDYDLVANDSDGSVSHEQSQSNHEQSQSTRVDKGRTTLPHPAATYSMVHKSTKVGRLPIFHLCN